MQPIVLGLDPVALPDRLEALEAEKAQLGERLGDPDLYKDGGGEAATLTRRLQELEDELTAAYARWEALEAIAEAARG